MKIAIVPACIPYSKEDIRDFTEKVSFTNEIQIDVVDGEFATPQSWPYEPSGFPKSIKAYTDPFTLEIDLMVSDPISAAKEWTLAGADMLVFHVESTDLDKLKNFIKYNSVSIGISYCGETSFEKALPYLEIADYVQLMGIKEIGKQGMPFDESVLDKISTIKKHFPELMISIDGGVSDTTAKILVEKGAHRLVSGSAILKAEDSEEAYRKLQESVAN